MSNTALLQVVPQAYEVNYKSYTMSFSCFTQHDIQLVCEHFKHDNAQHEVVTIGNKKQYVVLLTCNNSLHFFDNNDAQHEAWNTADSIIDFIEENNLKTTFCCLYYTDYDGVYSIMHVNNPIF